MKCALCDKEGTSRPTEGGADYGPACDAHASLLWSAWLDFTTNQPTAERDVTRWQMRKATQAGFTEPCPKSAAEKELSRIIAEKDWTREASEAETQARTLNLAELLNVFAEIKGKEKS